MKKILLMLSLLFFTTAGFSEVSDTLVTGGLILPSNSGHAAK